jgi:hypothetical protein
VLRLERRDDGVVLRLEALPHERSVRLGLVELIRQGPDLRSLGGHLALFRVSERVRGLDERRADRLHLLAKA